MELIPPVRCSARSSRTGNPCKNYAIVGGKVCNYHGGAAPQVREAARKRIAAMVPYAEMGIAQLAGVPYLNPDTDEVEIRFEGIASKEEVRLRALQDILDRAGLKGADKLEVTETPVDNEALDALIQAALKNRLGEE